MLGLKLNHVSKRGHWGQNKQRVHYTLNSGIVGRLNIAFHIVRKCKDQVVEIHSRVTYDDYSPDSKVHGANMGSTGPRWAPCWPHDSCYLGLAHKVNLVDSLVMQRVGASACMVVCMGYSIVIHGKSQVTPFITESQCWRLPLPWRSVHSSLECTLQSHSVATPTGVYTPTTLRIS